MKVGLAADHGGYDLKEIIKDHLKEKNIEYIDYGTESTDSVDYPDYALKLGEAIKNEEVDTGIAICGTGIGMSIALNKVPGIRAAHCTDTFSARAARRHNNAHVLCLGARITGSEIAKDIVDNYLESSFDGGRHQRRIDKITEIER